MGLRLFPRGTHATFDGPALRAHTAVQSMLMPSGVNFFADVGIVYAFWHSNVAGKLVILLLLLLSMFSWSVMVTKLVMVRRARAQTQRFLRRFRTARKPLAIYQSREVYTDSPAYLVYMAGCKELLFHLLGTTELDDTFSSRVAEADRISPVSMNSVRSALEREVGEQALRMEDRMTVLATAVSGAPFLGLLGTVWGVMDTFSAIAAAHSANLTTMAPGVSGALITTVTGLLVAIPAMFGYNFLVVTLRGMTVELDNFAAELASSFDHRYLDTGSPAPR